MKTSSALLVLALFTARPGSAATPPVGFEDTELFTANAPTGLAYEPGSGNAFVLEKGDGSGGARVRRRALAGGAVTTALSLTCVDAGGERGLLGIAFDPDYLQSASTRWVYLYYTRLSPSSGACSIAGSPGSRNRVVRFKEAGGVLSGEELLLEGPTLTTATNHNGGTLRFSPEDETLFVSMGDNDTDATSNPLSRDLSDLRGKILRIRRDGTVPNDNPFFGQAGARGEIWAWGLRNPFRFSIDVDGMPWIGDVGEGDFEEIDRGLAGADYGYPCFEGDATFQSCDPDPVNPIAPAFVYGHSVGTAPFSGATVIGGPVYRNGNFSASYEGRLFFGDYVSDWIRSAKIDPGGTLSDVQLFIPDASSVVDIVQAPNGCLGWVSIGGSIHETCHTTDQDGDAVLSVADGGTDCNDLDAAVYPGAPELCDDKDNDCNLDVDEATCAAFGGTDGAMNGLDLALLGRFFGLCSGTPQTEPWAAVEFTKDGCLDGKDLTVMAAVWGCSGTAPLCH